MARTVDFSIVQNDTAPAIEAQLVDSAGTPISLLNVTDVTFILSDTNKLAVLRQTAEILSSQTAIVRYRWKTGDTDVAGRYLGQWVLTYDDDSVESFPNASYMSVRIESRLVGDTFTVHASDTETLSGAAVGITA
jgi:hypothetical protein